MTVNQKALTTAMVVALGAYALAAVAELAFIRAFRPSQQELTWIRSVPR